MDTTERSRSFSPEIDRFFSFYFGLAVTNVNKLLQKNIYIYKSVMVKFNELAALRIQPETFKLAGR